MKKYLFLGIAILIGTTVLISSCSPTAPKSSDKEITAFSIASPAVGGVIDTGAKTITVLVPRGTDLAALVATFTATGAKVGVGSAEQVSGVTANNFSTPVVYTVTAEDNSAVNYTVTVTFQKYCLFVSTLADSGDSRDVPVINKLRSWGYEVKVVASSTTLTWTVADSFSQYDFAFLSESPNSSDYTTFRGHPIPLLNLEAWAAVKPNVLNWSRQTSVKNFDALPLIVATSSISQLTGGITSGQEFKLTDSTIAAGQANIGFIPTIQYIPIATFKDNSCVDSVIAFQSLDSSFTAIAGGVLTVACAVESGTLLADSVTTVLNRAVTIGIHANAYQFITAEGYALIKAGIQWILKESATAHD